MKIRAFKYASPFLFFALAMISFVSTSWLTFLPVAWAYILIPLAELIIKPDERNLEAAEEEMAKADKFYDYILYAVVPLLYGSLIFFLYSVQKPVDGLTLTGRIMSMGLLCGAFGINVAHELGHRTNRFEQLLAKILLLTSQYMHFFIEHNRGHHKHVATPNDPSSARKNEWIFAFYFRTIINSYLSAWRIEKQELVKKGKAVASLQNQIVRFTILQLAFVAVIYFVFGGKVTACYLAAALLGILLLEAVNYIEHYGLRRKEIEPRKFERAMPFHSWNSNHAIGRLMLFELSRHSDHHYLASRKYQVLRHHHNSPQLPTGYPGMMILAHVPPLFIKVMNRKLREFETAAPLQEQQLDMH